MDNAPLNGGEKYFFKIKLFENKEFISFILGIL